MKWLFVLLLAVIIFGGAALFSYKIFFKQEIAVRAEQESHATPQPTPDFGLNEFRAAKALKDDGRLGDARNALTAFLQRYPTGGHADEAKDLLGATNVAILFSRYPSPDKKEYIVKKGDVLARVAAKVKSTPELVMRMNGLSGTMLHIGEHLMVAHPDFSLLLQRNQRDLIVLNNRAFFKRYHLLEVKLPPKQPAHINTRVAEIIAWKNGKRVGFGSKDYATSTRWIRLNASGYILYATPNSTHFNPGLATPSEGVALASNDLTELSALVNSKTPVTITD